MCSCYLGKENIQMKYRKISELISCLIATLLTLVAFYRFGRLEDIVYIKYALNPQNFNDPIYFSFFHTPYGYVDKFMAMVYSLVKSYVSMESFIITIYGLLLFISLYLMLKLINEIFKIKIVGILMIFAFILNIRIISLGSPHLIKYHFTPLFFALPLLLPSLMYFYRGKYIIAFSLAALSLNAHSSTSLYLILIYSLLILFNIKKINFKEIFLSFVICVLLASPTVIPVLLSIKSKIIIESWVVEYFRLAHYGHISFYYLLKYGFSSTILSIMILVVLIICNNHRSDDEKRRIFINNFILASVVLYIIQIIGADFFKSFFFIRLEIPSSTWFIMLLGLGVFINYIVYNFNIHNRNYIYIMAVLGGRWLTVLGALGYIGKSILGSVGIFRNTINKILEKYDLLYFFLLVSFIMAGIFFKKFNTAYMLFIISLVLSFCFYKRTYRYTNIGIILFIIFIAINYYSTNNPKAKVQDLPFYNICKETKLLKNDAKVIYPLDKYDYYLYGERGGFVSYYYPAMIKYNMELFDYTYRICKDLGVDLKELNKYNWKEMWYSAWIKLDKEHFLKLKNRYKVSHIIRENKLILNFPCIAKNEKYSLYIIK